MKEAIQKAIEGGYEMWGWEPKYDGGDDFSRMLLHALFWQCLGKALGWVGDYQMEDETWMVTGGNKNEDYHIPAWQSYWRRFIDHLAEGKSADDFFNQLLK